MKAAVRILLLAALAWPLTSSACQRIEWTLTARLAYQKAMQLRLDESRDLIGKLRASDPGNCVVILIEDYIDFFTVYIGEDLATFRKLEKNKDLRLSQLDQADDASPWKRYMQGDIRLHWALARLKFDEFTTAFLEVNKAYKLLAENDRLFPDFLPNKKDLGILHAAVGTIPENYQWTVDWMTSMEGSLEQGRTELETVIAEPDFIFRDEALVLYTYLLLHLGNEAEAAWQVLETHDLNPSQNPLASFVVANVAMRIGKNDRAIDVLQKRPTGNAYLPFPYLDLMLGIAKLQRLDPDANVYIQRFLDTFKGRHFIKEGCQKLAWYYLLQKDQTKYQEWMNACKTRGYATVENDKSALREATSNEKPHPELLKSRLLFDGGYYQKAWEIASTLTPILFVAEKDQVECYYRKARILHALKRTDEAVALYLTTIEKGSKKPWYFACRAALETGKIYEAKGNTAKAREYYRLCLSIKPREYQTGLHQAAKAGMKRVE